MPAGSLGKADPDAYRREPKALEQLARPHVSEMAVPRGADEAEQRGAFDDLMVLLSDWLAEVNSRHCQSSQPRHQRRLTEQLKAV